MLTLYIHRSIDPSIHLSIYPSMHPSIHLSVRKQFCETSSKNETSQLQNEASLQDILKKSTLTTLKTKQFCGLSANLQMGCRADGLAPMRFVKFPPHLPEVLPLPWKSEARSYEVLHLSRKIILANLKIRSSKAQPLSGNLQLNFQKCSDHQWLSTRSFTLSLTLIFFLLMLSSLTLYLLWLFSQVLLHLSIRRKFDF